MIQTTIDAILTHSIAPDAGGYVYIIRSGPDVLYVGKTVNLLRRFKQHYTHTFREFRAISSKQAIRDWQVELRRPEECRAWVPEHCKYIDLETAEHYTIVALRPIFNGASNPFPAPMPERFKPLYELEAGLTNSLY